MGMESEQMLANNVGRCFIPASPSSVSMARSHALSTLVTTAPIGQNWPRLRAYETLLQLLLNKGEHDALDRGLYVHRYPLDEDGFRVLCTQIFFVDSSPSSGPEKKEAYCIVIQYVDETE